MPDNEEYTHNRSGPPLEIRSLWVVTWKGRLSRYDYRAYGFGKRGEAADWLKERGWKWIRHKTVQDRETGLRTHYDPYWVTHIEALANEASAKYNLPLQDYEIDEVKVPLILRLRR